MSKIRDDEDENENCPHRNSSDGTSHDDDCPSVDCDENCGALTNPKTLKEALKTLEHWRNHGLYNGCSHGC